MVYTYPTLQWPSKWPTEVLDYSINWKEAPATPADSDHDYVAVLDTANSETISTITHAITQTPDESGGTPLAIDSENTFDSNQQTVVWLSGGVTGTYKITATIVTSAGRTVFREITLKVL